MGAVLSAGLAAQLNRAAQIPNSPITVESSAEFAANPNALIDPQARQTLPAGAFEILQDAMASAIHRVFWVGTALAALALIVSFFLPRQGSITLKPPTEEECDAETGERMIMAELTNIDSEHEPVAAHGD